MCDHIGWSWNISWRYVCFFIRVHSLYDLQCNARGTRCGLHAHSWSTIWVPNLCIFSSHALLPPLPCHFTEVERQAYTTDSFNIFFIRKLSHSWIIDNFLFSICLEFYRDSHFDHNSSVTVHTCGFFYYWTATQLSQTHACDVCAVMCNIKMSASHHACWYESSVHSRQLTWIIIGFNTISNKTCYIRKLFLRNVCRNNF